MNIFDYEFNDEEVEKDSDWQPDVECPFCGSTDTVFVEMHYEMSVYECQVCNRQFEIEK